MKGNIKIEIPLSGRHESIELPGPCTYCDQEVSKTSEPWARRLEYGPRNRAADGTLEAGRSLSVTIRAPYCRKHEKGIRILSVLGNLWFMSIIALVVAGFILVSFPGWFSSSKYFNNIFWMVGGVVLLAIIGFFVAGMLAWGIKRLLALVIPLVNPELRDFAVTNGHWGLAVEKVRQEYIGGGSRKYTLPVAFVNVESARRFLAAYPDARVVGGKELLK